MARFWLFFSIVFITVGSDQLTKVIARKHLADAPARDFLGGLFSLQFTENPGAFLSLGAQLSETMRFVILTVIVAIVLVIATFYIFKKTTDQITVIGLSLLVGGGIGNLIDRASKGTVTDFMMIDIGFARTGIFNIADMVIMLGFGLLLIDAFKPSAKRATARDFY